MKESVKFKNVVMALAILFLAATIGYVCLDSVRTEKRVASIERRYLRTRERMENARALAKEQARLEILKHVKQVRRDEAGRSKNARKAQSPKRLPMAPNVTAEALARRSRELAREGYKAPKLPTGEFSGDEREIMDVADEVVSDHDFETAQEVAEAALKSEDPRVRLRAVEVLTEFGEMGLPELADFLSDSHPDVANLAADRFELAVQEIESESEQVAVAKLGMLSINDEDQLRSMAGMLTQSSDALQVISALADIILDGTSAQVAAAKEAYESETGEEWQGVDAAEQWLRENYEPPEPEESADENVGQEEGEEIP